MQPTELRSFAPAPTWMDLLTPAERQVAALLGEGLANKEIAGVLDRSELTVRNYVAAVMRKCRVQGRGRFIALYHRTLAGGLGVPFGGGLFRAP
ncbi:MAG TPA: helix-turn-helix transcriptional regulator [Opitutaceae bacterium]|nr:helix-turn-helix transcriptional regulator [Opitutaceae bacterium]